MSTRVGSVVGMKISIDTTNGVTLGQLEMMCKAARECEAEGHAQVVMPDLNDPHLTIEVGG